MSTLHAAPTVSIAFVRSALRALSPAQCDEVLTEAGIDRAGLDQAKARVPAAAFARLWLAVARLLDDEFFGLDARRMKLGSFAMLCHALAGQATVGAAMRQALRAGLAGATVIEVAHRLLAIERCDAVAVMEAGRVVEVGMPEELMARQGGTFAEMVCQQQQERGAAGGGGSGGVQGELMIGRGGAVRH